MSVQYVLTGNDDDANLVVFIPGFGPKVAHSSHPNFERILADVRTGDPSAEILTFEALAELFDIAKAVESWFAPLSDRVSVRGSRVYFDGVEVDNALTRQVVRFLEEGMDNWLPLVLFFEKVQTNPNEHSREQLYSWLANRDFSITDNGDIIGYKGVERDGQHEYISKNYGYATVDGVEYKNDRIPNPIGAVVEMPRDMVEWDPSVGCHTGLHVGTFEYAQSFASVVLEIHVNPRDVVSVPTDCDFAKVRCCRYRVVKEIEVKYSAPLIVSEYGYEDEEDDCRTYPDPECDCPWRGACDDPGLSQEGI